MTKRILMKITKAVLLSMALAIGIACMTGCSGSSDAQHETYILYAAHANQTVLDESDFAKEITKACEISENKITLISIEGSPVTVETYSIPKSGFMLLPSQKERKAKTYSMEILSDIAGIVPATGECDYGAAFNRIANNVSPEAEVNIIVKGSGMSTKGIVNYTKGLIGREANSSVEAVETANSLPRFNNLKNVWWTGLGQVSSPQKELSENQYRHLEGFWNLYLEKSGAKEVSINAGNSKSGSELSTELPKVTTIDLPKEDIIEYDDESNTSINEDASVISEEILGGFLADSASFAEKSKAENVAKKIASQLKEEKYIIAGFTAGDNSNEYCKKLSQERAEAFKRILVKNGTKEENLTAIGCGCGIDSGFTIRGLGTGAEASVNRICVILPAKSEMGKKLIDEYGEV